MDKLLESLGCKDIETTKARFLNDTDFYLEIVNEMLGDAGFETLGGQLERRETNAAFDTAHMLKGIAGNCGVTPLYDLIVQIVEPLRGGAPEYPALEETYRRLMEQRKTALTTLSAWI